MEPIRIEGCTPDELLALSDEEIDGLILCDRPVAFRIGSAEVLGQFRACEERLVVELAHIEGGGEGVLVTVGALADRFARRRSLSQVEWIVHAVSCARPNPRLRPLLERMGFTVEEIPGIGKAYRLVRMVGQ